MGSGHELILYAVHPSKDLQDAILGVTCNGQRFTKVCGNDTHPDGLPYSGQAFVPDVYVLSLRKAITDDVVEALGELTWRGTEAVLLVSGDYIDGPMEVHRLGYQPREDWLP